MSETEKIIDYASKDHAKKYKQLETVDSDVQELVDKDYAQVIQNGFVIIPSLLSKDECESIKDQTTPFLDKTGRNEFEGVKTQRIYNVLSKTRCLDKLATNPRIIGLLDKLFEPSYLLSQSQVINIQPGESQQTLHYDDGFYKIPRPRQPLGAATVWAIDEFTKTNGATKMVPGSHTWEQTRLPKPDEVISAAMPQGSVVFFLGTTWHGGGKNMSDQSRFAVTHQYCEAYMRQQENYLLELDKDTVRGLEPKLQSLIGYSIHPPFMGMVEGKHPLRLLEK